MRIGPLHGKHEPPFYVAGSDHWVAGYLEGAVRTGRGAAAALLVPDASGERRRTGAPSVLLVDEIAREPQLARKHRFDGSAGARRTDSRVADQCPYAEAVDQGEQPVGDLDGIARGELAVANARLDLVGGSAAHPREYSSSATGRSSSWRTARSHSSTQRTHSSSCSAFIGRQRSIIAARRSACELSDSAVPPSVVSPAWW